MSKPYYHGFFFVRALAALALIAMPSLGCKAKPPAADGSGGDASGDGSSQGGAQTSAAAPSAAASAGSAPAAAAPAAQTPAGSTVTPATTATDDLGTKLTAALQGVVFVSEADFPWSIVEADGATEVTSKAVADKLGPQIAKLQPAAGRDLSKLPVVIGEDGAAKFLDSLASDPDDPSAAKYAEVAKLVAASLQSTQVFFFDMDDSGVQVSGPIITVVAGKTAAGKLVAMVSFQVST